MSFKKGLAIPVFIMTEDEIRAHELNLLGKEAGFTKTEYRTFWDVSSAFRDEEHENYTIFYSDGISYISPIEYKTFVEMVNEVI